MPVYHLAVFDDSSNVLEMLCASVLLNLWSVGCALDTI